MSTKKLRAAGISPSDAGKIVYAVYRAAEPLAELSPAARYIAMKALCATFLTDGNDAVPVKIPAKASPPPIGKTDRDPGRPE